MVTISSMDILKWLTGASRIPAVGLDVVKVFFTSDTVLPRVNTCALELWLPLLPQFKDLDTFTRQIVEWIIDSAGFGLV